MIGLMILLFFAVYLAISIAETVTVAGRVGQAPPVAVGWADGVHHVS